MLTAIAIGVLIGFCAGFWLHYRAMNWLIKHGTLDVYRDGYKLEELRMW